VIMEDCCPFSFSFTKSDVVKCELILDLHCALYCRCKLCKDEKRVCNARPLIDYVQLKEGLVRKHEI